MINVISSEKFKGNSFVAKYDFNTTIIGGGVIGLSIAYSLSKKIEKEKIIGMWNPDKVIIITLLGLSVVLIYCLVLNVY